MCPTVPGHGARHEAWWLYPVRLHWRRLVSLLPAGVNWKKLLGFGWWDPMFLFTFQCRDPMAWTCGGPCACCHSLYTFPWASVLLCLKNTVSRKPWITPGSYSLSVSSSVWIPEPWGQKFDEDIPVRAERPKGSHSLHSVGQFLWASLECKYCLCCIRHKLHPCLNHVEERQLSCSLLKTFFLFGVVKESLLALECLLLKIFMIRSPHS